MMTGSPVVLDLLDVGASHLVEIALPTDALQALDELRGKPRAHEAAPPYPLRAPSPHFAASARAAKRRYGARSGAAHPGTAQCSYVGYAYVDFRPPTIDFRADSELCATTTFDGETSNPACITILA
jgi:hypothetical protein